MCSADKEKQYELKKIFTDKANDYRLHLDKLRYSLIGSYFVIWGVAVRLLGRNELSLSDTAMIYLLMFFIGIICFFIMAIQNWHYNMYSLYVKKCEKILQTPELPPISHADFSKDHYQDVTPMHDAFSFIFVLMWVTIAFNFSSCLTSFSAAANLNIHREFIVLSCFIFILALGFMSMRYWRSVYKIISFCQRFIAGKK